ncbi:hypothetical protein, partial [Geobacillus stearothermophilus]|uniref:hypothetical protein n=1 Tax=Geobacillus stearothermophilus TaxID=1422 RepID=UPI001F472EAC
FGHFQYTLTDQERIPHSPSGGDFHGKSSMSNFCSPPGHENDSSGRMHFHGKDPWAARFALHPA